MVRWNEVSTYDETGVKFTGFESVGARANVPQTWIGVLHLEVVKRWGWRLVVFHGAFF